MTVSNTNTAEGDVAVAMTCIVRITLPCNGIPSWGEMAWGGGYIVNSPNCLKGQCHGRYHDFWSKFTKIKL